MIVFYFRNRISEVVLTLLLLLLLSSGIPFSGVSSPFEATQARGDGPAQQLNCYILGEGAVMAPADMSLEEYLSLAPQPEGAGRKKYVVKDRWTSTATDGSVDKLEPITLTYSFVLDGTDISGAGFVGDPDGPSELFAQFAAKFPGGRDAWQAAIGSALERWGELTGITYVQVDDDGASFPSSGGSLGKRGDVRIGMHPIGAQAAAYNYFPNGGDLVLDSEDAGTLAISFGNFRLLRNVIAHEHGHGIGLNHVDPRNRTKLMETTTHTDFDGPQEDDIRGAQSQYGDAREANNSAEDASDLGDLALTPIVLDNLAVESKSLVDFYAFNVPDNALLNVTVAPVGSSYEVGPLGETTSIVDALAIHDLAFEIVDADKSGSLAAVNETGAGEAETLSDYALPSAAGTYYLRVSSGSSVSDVQRYSLEISRVLPTVPEASARTWLLYE